MKSNLEVMSKKFKRIDLNVKYSQNSQRTSKEKLDIYGERFRRYRNDPSMLELEHFLRRCHVSEIDMFYFF